MWRIVLTRFAGMLIAIAGVVWTLQGLGFVEGNVSGIVGLDRAGDRALRLAVTVTGLRRS